MNIIVKKILILFQERIIAEPFDILSISSKIDKYDILIKSLYYGGSNFFENPEIFDEILVINKN